MINDEQAKKLFIEELRKNDRSEATVRNYVYDLKYFERWQGAHRGDGVLSAGSQALKEYRHHLEKSGQASTTVNRRLQSLRTFYNTMIERGQMKTNPLDGVKPIKIAHQNDTRWLEPHQVRQIFEAIDKTAATEEKRVLHRAIVSVLVNSGLRIQELCNLKRENLNFKLGYIDVIGKGNKFRKVPFGKATQKAVMQWYRYRRPSGEFVFMTQRSDHMTTRAVQHITERLSDSLPFTFSAHQLRHTALKRIADKTGKIEIVAAVAGHENVETSRRYIEPSLAEIADAMQDSEFDY